MEALKGVMWFAGVMALVAVGLWLANRATVRRLRREQEERDTQFSNLMDSIVKNTEDRRRRAQSKGGTVTPLRPASTLRSTTSALREDPTPISDTVFDSVLASSSDSGPSTRYYAPSTQSCDSSYSGSSSYDSGSSSSDCGSSSDSGSCSSSCD